MGKIKKKDEVKSTPHPKKCADQSEGVVTYQGGKKMFAGLGGAATAASPLADVSPADLLRAAEYQDWAALRKAIPEDGSGRVPAAAASQSAEEMAAAGAAAASAAALAAAGTAWDATAALADGAAAGLGVGGGLAPHTDEATGMNALHWLARNGRHTELDMIAPLCELLAAAHARDVANATSALVGCCPLFLALGVAPFVSFSELGGPGKA